jgi:hypothetical protein
MNGKINLIIRTILISYVFGTPVGMLVIIIAFLFPAFLTQDGLATMLLLETYGKAILGLIITFLFALGFGGYIIYRDFKKGRTLLVTSVRYSLVVNLLIWSVFVLITIIENSSKDITITLVPPVIAFIFCILITPFTIGLLICYLIRDKVRFAQSNT